MRTKLRTNTLYFDDFLKILKKLNNLKIIENQHFKYLHQLTNISGCSGPHYPNLASIPHSPLYTHTCGISCSSVLENSCLE